MNHKRFTDEFGDSLDVELGFADSTRLTPGVYLTSSMTASIPDTQIILRLEQAEQLAHHILALVAEAKHES